MSKQHSKALFESEAQTVVRWWMLGGEGMKVKRF